MLGLGLGSSNFGGGDSVITTIGIDARDAFAKMHQLERWWLRVDAAQAKAAQSANAFATAQNKANKAANGFNSHRFMAQGGTAAGATMAASAGAFGGGRGVNWGMAANGMSGSMVAAILAAGNKGMETFESEDLVKQVFGKRTGDINKWSGDLSKRLGFNQYDTRRDAAQFQTQFTAGGMDEGKATEMSKSYVRAAKDLQSFYNVKDAREVQAALQSGINGESEPLRKYAIYLSDAATKEYAYRKGIAATNEELTEQQKLQARAGFILEQFNKGKAKNNAEMTKDSPANRLRAQQNQLAEQFTGIGMSLMPLAGDVLTLTKQLVPPIQSAVKWFTSLDESSRRWLLVLGVALPQATRLVGLFKDGKDLLGFGKGLAGGIGKGGLGLGGGCCCGGAGGMGAGSGGAGGAGATGAARAGWLARLGITGATAFGMGAVATGAVLTAGAVAAYKLPGYMRDATHKSDEEMAKSSDPLQRFHSWAGRGLGNWWVRGDTEKGDAAEAQSMAMNRKRWLVGHNQRQNELNNKARAEKFFQANYGTGSAYAEAQSGLGVVSNAKPAAAQQLRQDWDERTKKIYDMFYGDDSGGGGSRNGTFKASRTRDGGAQIVGEIPPGIGEAVARNLRFIVNSVPRVPQ